MVLLTFFTQKLFTPRDRVQFQKWKLILKAYEYKARAAGKTPSACLVHVFVFLVKALVRDAKKAEKLRILSALNGDNNNGQNLRAYWEALKDLQRVDKSLMTQRHGHMYANAAGVHSVTPQENANNVGLPSYENQQLNGNEKNHHDYEAKQPSGLVLYIRHQKAD